MLPALTNQHQNALPILAVGVDIDKFRIADPLVPSDALTESAHTASLFCELGNDLSSSERSLHDDRPDEEPRKALHARPPPEKDPEAPTPALDDKIYEKAWRDFQKRDVSVGPEHQIHSLPSLPAVMFADDGNPFVFDADGRFVPFEEPRVPESSAQMAWNPDLVSPDERKRASNPTV